MTHTHIHAHCLFCVDRHLPKKSIKQKLCTKKKFPKLIHFLLWSTVLLLLLLFFNHKNCGSIECVECSQITIKSSTIHFECTEFKSLSATAKINISNIYIYHPKCELNLNMARYGLFSSVFDAHNVTGQCEKKVDIIVP